MPLKQLRICTWCNDRIRWAPCGKACQIEKAPWVANMQQGAGSIVPPREAGVS